MAKRAWCAAVLVTAIAAGNACDTRSPVSPAPPLPPPPPPPSTAKGFTVSGLAIDHSGASQPRGGIPLQVVVLRPDVGGNWIYRSVTSDATGRFEVNEIQPGPAIIIAPPSDSDFGAPCPAGTTGLFADQSFTVNVVSRSTLVSTGTPGSMPLTNIWFSGRVFETLPSGRHPVAGATVHLAGDDSDRWVYSSTLSDAAGRYLVCSAPPGVGTDQTAWIRVSGDGYQSASREVFGGWDYGDIDIELVRR
jgi:hypothetical protein